MFLEANIAKKHQQTCDNSSCLRDPGCHEAHKGYENCIKEGSIYYQLDIGNRSEFWTCDQSFMIFCEDCLEKAFNLIKAEVKFKAFK